MWLYISVLSVASVVFGFLILEALRASRNERAQCSRGGVEPAGDVYRLMRIAYPGCFAAMIVEGAMRGVPSRDLMVAGAVVFAAAKALKWWAILSLGPFWTFRVIVVPGSARVGDGPYRWVRHPNYVAVIAELVGVGLMTGARITGPIALVVFAALLVKRIAVEDRILEASTR
jgi:methyltransferase